MMMHKIQASLNDVIWQPRTEDEVDEPYEAKPVSQLKQQFIQKMPQANKPVRRSPRQSAPSKPAWIKPRSSSPPTSLTEPGWAPKNYSKTWHPVRRPPGPAAHAPQPQQQHHIPRPAPPPQEPISNGSPAWSGSLRSASGSKPWDGPNAPPAAPPAQRQVQFQQPSPAQAAAQVHTPRHQNVHYAPGQAPQYQQLPAQQQQQQDGGGGEGGDGPRVVHMQYNSPIGLYSKSAAEEVLVGQTTGQPGQGSLQIQGGGPAKEFDPSKSSVLRLLQEEQRGGGAPRRQQYEQQQQQYGAHPAQQAQPYDPRYAQEEEMGSSEF